MKAAALVAAAGVVWLAIDLGQLPWISLVLAFSFGLYGLLRKIAPVGALIGLTVETLLLAPLAARLPRVGDGPRPLRHSCPAGPGYRRPPPAGRARDRDSAAVLRRGRPTASPLHDRLPAVHRRRRSSSCWPSPSTGSRSTARGPARSRASGWRWPCSRSTASGGVRPSPSWTPDSDHSGAVALVEDGAHWGVPISRLSSRSWVRMFPVVTSCGTVTSRLAPSSPRSSSARAGTTSASARTSRARARWSGP